MSECGGIDCQAEQLCDIAESAGNLAQATCQAGIGFGNLASNMQTAGRIGSSAMITLDRIQISEDALSNAHVREQMAQQNLTLAVQQYGAGSTQAIKAQEQLSISTNAVGIAQERLEVRMVYGAAVVLPGMINGLQDLAEQFVITTAEGDSFTLSIEDMTAAELANIAVMTLGVGLPIALMALNMANMASSSTTNNNLYGNMNVFQPSSSPAAFGQGFASAGRG